MIPVRNNKLNVILKSQQLFIKNGLQATSIQDVLDHCGISKGTFYNYFSSKTELLIEVLHNFMSVNELERDALLVGKKVDDLDIFIEQVEHSLSFNKKKVSIHLFEEMFRTADIELKKVFTYFRQRLIKWVAMRFIDIFGESKQEYALDCAITFIGMLNTHMRFCLDKTKFAEQIHSIVLYCVNRIVEMMEVMPSKGEKLHSLERLNKQLQTYAKKNNGFEHDLVRYISLIKTHLNKKDIPATTELLDFLQEELLTNQSPRKFLINSTMMTLNNNQTLASFTEMKQLTGLIAKHFKNT